MLNWLLIPAIVILGIITSYTDIKYGKIKNKWIIIFFLYGILIYGIYFFYSYFADTPFVFSILVGEKEIEYSIFIQVLSNLFLSVVFGVVIWLFNIWSAADAKLFIIFSFLMPLTIYTTDFIRYFPGLIIAINSIFIFIFFFIYRVFRKEFKKFKDALKETLTSPKELLNDAQMLFLIHWLMTFIFTYIDRQELTIFFIVGILFIVIYFVRTLGKLVKRFKYIILIAVLLRIIVDFQNIFSIDFLVQFSILFFVFCFLKTLFLKIAETSFQKRIHIEKLKPGMISDTHLVDTGKRIKVQKNSDEKIAGKNIIIPSIEGLTKEEIDNIQKAYKKNKLDFDSIDITTKTCFAPFLFASALITMILGGSIITFIIEAFQNLFALI